MNLVDSSAWLAYFANETNAPFFAEAIEDTALLLVPTVCLCEVFKVLLRERGGETAFRAVAAMRQGTMIDLTPDLALEAALAHEAKLALADSIIAATAQEYGAVIWTQDEHFSARPNVEFRRKAD
jgi:predicted nucleic acid-binding protein